MNLVSNNLFIFLMETILLHQAIKLRLHFSFQAKHFWQA